MELGTEPPGWDRLVRENAKVEGYWTTSTSEKPAVPPSVSGDDMYQAIAPQRSLSAPTAPEQAHRGLTCQDTHQEQFRRGLTSLAPPSSVSTRVRQVGWDPSPSFVFDEPQWRKKLEGAAPNTSASVGEQPAPPARCQISLTPQTPRNITLYQDQENGLWV